MEALTVVNAVLVALVLGIAVPIVSKLVTHIHASATVKSAIAVVLAGLGSVAAWATSIPGVTSWKVLATVALGGLATAALQRWTWLEPYVTAVEKLFPGWFGVLGKPDTAAPVVATAQAHHDAAEAIASAAGVSGNPLAGNGPPK